MNSANPTVNVRLKNKLIMLAVLPLLTVIAVVGTIVYVQAEQLASLQAEAIGGSQLAAGKKELRHYVSLAATAISELQARGLPDDVTQQRARAILEAMNYGDDGYFFAYTLDGTNIVHPRQKELVGQNLWNMRDPQGLQVIKGLIDTAVDGDGFLRYEWRKPSNGLQTGKLAYVTLIKPWNWMIGTGIYLDDMEHTQQRVREETARNIRHTMGLLAAIASLAVLLVFAAGLALNFSESRLADRKLRALAQRIVDAQEEERARLSRELHDGISQALVSIKYQFELAEHKLATGHDSAGKDLQQGIERLAGAIAEVRRISHDLRPTLLDDLGLAAALTELGADFARHTGIHVDTGIAGMQAEVPADIALTLFRVAQEALNNIERHAGASRIDLRLDGNAAALTLCIEDDGHGFNPAEACSEGRRGIGLRNMRERVEYLGGRLDIESRPGHTRLTIVLPLSEAEGDPA